MPLAIHLVLCFVLVLASAYPDGKDAVVGDGHGLGGGGAAGIEQDGAWSPRSTQSFYLGVVPRSEKRSQCRRGRKEESPSEWRLLRGTLPSRVTLRPRSGIRPV